MKGESIRSTELVEINAPVRFFDAPLAMWRNAREHRQLISNFIQRDFRLKYRNSSLGYFWSLLEPLMLSGIYFVLYALLVDEPDAMRPLWIFLGAVTFGFFTKVLTDALGSLTANEGMIKQVYFPREIFAVTSAGSQLLMTGLSLLIAIPFMIYYGLAPTAYLLMVPIGLVLAGMLALGIGLGLACVNVVNRDVGHFFRFATRAGFFLSPVMWRFGDLPESRAKLADLLMLNPVAVPITMVRNGIDGSGLSVIPPLYVAYSVVFCVGSFLLGSMVFKRFEAEMVKKI